MYCRKCGKEIGDDKFCPFCGADQNENMNVHNESVQQQYYQEPVKTDMSVGDWVIALILCLIPIVGIVFLIIWAAGSSDKKPSRKNWALAQLIIFGVVIVISVIFVVVMGFSIGK